MADDTGELHRFAASIGVHRLVYQGPPRTSAPHYDITAFERSKAVRLGAIECSREEIVAVFRRVRVPGSKVARLPPAVPQKRLAERRESVLRANEHFKIRN